MKILHVVGAHSNFTKVAPITSTRLSTSDKLSTSMREMAKHPQEFEQWNKEGERQMREKDLLERITVDPKVMVGKPVIRGTRIPVALILKMLGQGIPVKEILREYPRLEEVDIHAAMAYAARVVEHEEVFPLLSWGELVPA